MLTHPLAMEIYVFHYNCHKINHLVLFEIYTLISLYYYKVIVLYDSLFLQCLNRTAKLFIVFKFDKKKSAGLQD